MKGYRCDLAKGHKIQAADNERARPDRMGQFVVCERRYALMRARMSFSHRRRTGGPKIGSSTSIAAVMQTRSRKVEMPSGLSLPLAFSMYTRLIGSGR